MAISLTLLSINTSLTLSIGLISFFIVWNASQKIETDVLKEFSHRLMLVIGVLIIYIAYWGLYNAAFRKISFARYPLYLALIFVFLYLMWSVMSFKKISEKYGMTDEDKIEKMEKQEIGA
ncbi:MAG: hypothetical protein ABEJ87_03885 [Candidatus Nanohalobium sp.]